MCVVSPMDTCLVDLGVEDLHHAQGRGLPQAHPLLQIRQHISHARLFGQTQLVIRDLEQSSFINTTPTAVIKIVMIATLYYAHCVSSNIKYTANARLLLRICRNIIHT